MNRTYEYNKNSMMLESLIKTAEKARKAEDELKHLRHWVWSLAHRLANRSDMLQILVAINRAKRTEMISHSDHSKLLKLWRRVWRRKRCHSVR